MSQTLRKKRKKKTSFICGAETDTPLGSFEELHEQSDYRGNSSRHHSFHDDYFGAQLLVDGKNVDQAQSEDHEVYGQDCTSCLVGVLHHPAETKALTLCPLRFSLEL